MGHPSGCGWSENRQLQKQIQGSFDCGTHGDAVSAFAQDDDLLGWLAVCIPTHAAMRLRHEWARERLLRRLRSGSG